MLSFSLLIASAANAQTKKMKQENPKKKEQKDTTKPAGTLMAINSSGLPSKGKKTLQLKITTEQFAIQRQILKMMKEIKTDEKK